MSYPFLPVHEQEERSVSPRPRTPSSPARHGPSSSDPSWHRPRLVVAAERVHHYDGRVTLAVRKGPLVRLPFETPKCRLLFSLHKLHATLRWFSANRNHHWNQYKNLFRGFPYCLYWIDSQGYLSNRCWNIGRFLLKDLLVVFMQWINYSKEFILRFISLFFILLPSNPIRL